MLRRETLVRTDVSEEVAHIRQNWNLVCIVTQDIAIIILYIIIDSIRLHMLNIL
jgi:hypothetical protein